MEKKQQALDALYDVIKSKKHRTWQKIHEPIMEQYLELCVELKKSHVAKEGLYQYKNICQQVQQQWQFGGANVWRDIGTICHNHANVDAAKFATFCTKAFMYPLQDFNY